MATRQQQTGRIAPGRPVYEEFRPISEWKPEEQSHLLLVYLPGFTKEQIKVSTEGTNSIRVRGERLVGGNKWSRFQEGFLVPEECNLRSIRAKFEGGTLTITMPKKSAAVLPPQIIPTKVAAKTTASEAAAAPRPPQTSDQVPPKIIPTIGEAAKPDRKGIIEELSSQKVATVPKSQKTQVETPLKPPASSTDALKKQPDGKGVGSTSAARIVQEMTETEERNQGKGKPMEVKTPENIALEKTTHKATESSEKGKESRPHANIIETSVKKEKEDSEGSIREHKGKSYDTADVAKEKLTADVSSGGGGAADGFMPQKYTQAVKGLITKGGSLHEERQLIVNMGTAILVIVALGAYISYTLGSSSGKTEQ